MISIPRSWARDLRAVFRRLTRYRRGQPLAIALTVERELLVVHGTSIDGAVEFRHHCPGPDAHAIVPLEALADCEGKDDSAVTIHSVSETQAELRWSHNGVPHVRCYDAPEVKGSFPEPPATWTANPVALLDALNEAVATVAEAATRYALDHVQLKGAGEVIASDSKQLLIQGGFEFPWDDDVLVSRVGLAAVNALTRFEFVQVGRTDGFIWIRTGPWSLALPLATEARYPDVHAIIPSRKSDTTRLVLDSTDADLLVAVLPDLPGADHPFRPVTVDLNGSIAIRAKAADQAQATELLLSRSQRSGPALRLVLDRNHLGRSRKLGFDAIDVVAPTRPVVCRNGSRIYVAMPLDEKLAIPSSEDVLRVGDPAMIRSATARPRAPIPTRAPAKLCPAQVAMAAGPAKAKKPTAPIVAKGPPLRRPRPFSPNCAMSLVESATCRPRFAGSGRNIGL
jgi:hypothetical protein